MPVSYYEQLKANLNADATAKKAALDAVYNAYTQAQFDAAGNVSYKEPGKLGTRDVQYDTEKRNIAAAGESGGTLRSGQQARNMATSLAAYKADVLGKSGQLAADKSAVDTATTSKLAEYQATYGTPASTGTPATPKTTTTKKKPDEIKAPPEPTKQKTTKQVPKQALAPKKLRGL